MFHIEFHEAVPVVKLWSILPVLPTAVKLTREGEEEVREFATGSTTSSRVMELMSSATSHITQLSNLT